MVDNTEQRILLSDEAKRLVGDPLFNGVLSSLLRDYMARLTDSVPGSPEGIAAHAGVRALDEVKRSLAALGGDGAVLRKNMESKARRDAHS